MTGKYNDGVPEGTRFSNDHPIVKMLSQKYVGKSEESEKAMIEKWKKIGKLAEELGFQLIYATAIKDFNAQSCFSHIVQLRKVAHDRTHNRTHVGRIESAEFTAHERQ